MRNRILEYPTGLIDLAPSRNISTRLQGAGWTAVLRRQHDRPTITSEGQEREVVLLAGNWHSAYNALQLIIAAYHLRSGHPADFESQSFLIPWNDRDPHCIKMSRVYEQLRSGTWATDGIWSGCEVAAKASRRRNWHYALTKYAFSQSLFALRFVELDPNKGNFVPLSRHFSDHVRFSHAIVAAHSILEDLGLEIRASASRPTKINGQWNPVVKNDLEERLSSAGIDIRETLLWTLRGPNSRLNVKRPIPSRGKQRWAYGWVRDCEVELLDAIAHVDWLRDKVASHSAKVLLSQSLSPYDVVNAQHLARRVLLGALGFWRR
jgi:hypothetical protein